MADYISTLTGVQMDNALLDMAEHNSEAYAVGERAGVPVDTSDVTYHNNSRYYAQLATSAIVGDATSAVRWDTDQSTALTDAQKAVARNNIDAGKNGAWSNRNLLDNPWFTVNQRSASGTVTQPNYGVDRWRVNGTTGATISFATGQVTLPASGTELLQILPIETVEMGSTVTLSVILADGTIVSDTATIASSYSANTYVINTTADGVRLRFTYRTNGVWHINFAATDSTDHIITAAKLEKGSVSTLANDAPPNYAEELAKCQYYFERIKNPAANALSIGYADATEATDMYLPLKIAPKHKIPTVSISGTIKYGRGSLSSAPQITSMALWQIDLNTGYTTMQVKATGLTATTAYRIALNTSAYIDFSADL